jgi:mono/diheme cytochrome c family protein
MALRIALLLWKDETMRTTGRACPMRANFLGQARVPRACLVLGMFALLGGLLVAEDGPARWVAPGDARNVKNPIPPTEETLNEAQQVYMDNCMLCHGEKGKGDGPGSKTLTVKPADLTDPKRMATETDGSLFWKMTTGRGPMPAWKATLSETDRWKLVSYLRKLGEDAGKN